MPALTISAVNTGTDEFTVTAHGQVTGNGPAAVRSIDGSLPAPLAAVTDYWLIVVDANTVKLATSSANALLGTAINITTSGSGTILLEIGIPFRRARTYAGGSQVKSADLNAIQDALVSVHELFTGQAQSVWNGVDLLSSGESSIVPIQRWRDWQGKSRALVDHNGYRMGQVSEWEEHWRVATGAFATGTPPGWTVTASGTGTNNVSDPDASFPMRHTLQGAGTNTGFAQAIYLMTAWHDAAYLAVWEAMISVATLHANTLVKAGLVFSNSAAFDRFVAFRFAGASGNWRGNVGADAAGTDLGVAVASATPIRARIEVVGDSHHSGSNSLARFYINGAKVGEVGFSTFGQPDAYGTILRAESTGVSSNTLLRVGRIRHVWNHRLDQDVL